MSSPLTFHVFSCRPQTILPLSYFKALTALHLTCIKVVLSDFFQRRHAKAIIHRKNPAVLCNWPLNNPSNTGARRQGCGWNLLPCACCVYALSPARKLLTSRAVPQATSVPLDPIAIIPSLLTSLQHPTYLSVQFIWVHSSFWRVEMVYSFKGNIGQQYAWNK